MADDEENTGPPYFSPDVVLEILVRLPPSARRRCRFVCQSWRDAVDTHTTEMQSRAKPLVATTGLAYVVDDLSPPARSRLLWKDGVAHREEGTSVVGTCNGLICLCDNRESGGAITLINPATQEALAIPPLPCAPGTDACCWHETYSFAYHPTTGRYNVVHVPCYYDSARVFRLVQVFTLGEASWRDVVTPPAAICNRSAGVVSVDGATYWVAEGSEDRIMSFDLDTERVTCTQPLPMPARPIRHLTQVNRRLAIATPTYGQPSYGYSAIEVRISPGHHILCIYAPCL
jgi:F-box interacting protein